MKIEKAKRDRKCWLYNKKHIKEGEKCIVNVQGYPIPSTQSYSKKCIIKLIKKL